MQYTFPQLENYKFNSKVYIEESKYEIFTRSLLTSLKRGGFYNHIETITNMHEHRLCVFCSQRMARSQFKSSYTLDENNNVTISSCGGKRDTEYGKYFACSEKGCPRLKINPNSVEFVSKVYSLSEEDALKIIHQRNTSPFYRGNYDSEDEYLKHQRHDELSEDEKKQKSSKQWATYFENKRIYILENGIESWDQKNSELKDNSSFRYFLRKTNDDELAKKLFLEKVSKTINLRPTYNSSKEDCVFWLKTQYKISNEVDFKNECYKRLSGYGEIGRMLQIGNLEKKIRKLENLKELQYFIWLGFVGFGITENLDSYFNISNEILKIKNNFNTNMFSYSIVADKLFFRSDLEYSFYKKLKEKENVEILDTNKRYPIENTRRMYDFKIFFRNKIYFLEICSNLSNGYVEDQLMKMREFSSICVSKKFFNKFFKTIEENVDLEGIKFYEHA